MTTFPPGSYMHHDVTDSSNVAPGNFLDSLWAGDTKLLVFGCGARAVADRTTRPVVAVAPWAYILNGVDRAGSWAGIARCPGKYSFALSYL